MKQSNPNAPTFASDTRSASSFRGPRRGPAIAGVALAAACLAALVAVAAESPWAKARALWQKADQQRAKSDFAGAVSNYTEAAATFDAARAPRFAQAAREMVEMCRGLPVKLSSLKAGTYTGRAPGYTDDVAVELRIMGGRITQMQVTGQKESRPLDAIVSIPRAVLSRQSPSVDAVTGATVTSYATMAAAFRAIQAAAGHSNAGAPEPATATPPHHDQGRDAGHAPAIEGGPQAR